MHRHRARRLWWKLLYLFAVVALATAGGTMLLLGGDHDDTSLTTAGPPPTLQPAAPATPVGSSFPTPTPAAASAAAGSSSATGSNSDSGVGTAGASVTGAAPAGPPGDADPSAAGTAPPNGSAASNSSAPPNGSSQRVPPTAVPAPAGPPSGAAPTRPATVAGTPSPPARPSAPATTAYAAQVVALTNAQRVLGGCAPLRSDAALTTAAQGHSADMAAHDYVDHDGRDGSSPFDRMTAAGYAYSAAAENIAAGQPSPAAVVGAWMASPEHRANIMNCRFRDIGVGYASGGSYGTYWTQDLGTPR